MSKLIMCKGLPGSGKSTWARTQFLSPTVNKDDIRAEFERTGHWTWSREREADVLKVRDDLITKYLKEGLTVISSDTNLAPKHETTLRRIAKQLGADFEIKSFLDVPLDTCIARDGMRAAGHVGEKVIRNMNTQFKVWQETPQKVEVIPNLPPAIICDLDGTLAIHNGRGPFDYARCDEDLPNPAVMAILQSLRFQGLIRIIFMSGREDSARPKTVEWLSRLGFYGNDLHMRKSGDFRKDYIVKAELFDQNVRGKYNVAFCLDDRDQVVKLWRDMGLACLQVNYGNF